MTQTKIKTIKHINTGEPFAPRTHIKAVLDSSGNSLESLLNIQTEKISDFEDLIFTVDGDEEIGNIKPDLNYDAVRKSAQLLTSQEQQQVRSNIGAVSKNELETFKTSVKNQFDNFRPVEVNGTVTNQADEEDLTSNEENLLSLKDRNNLNGMGYVILRRNKTLAEQMNLINTIYEIRYDFDLNGGELNVPENCVLKFEGGSFSNGTIVGNNTVIDAKLNKIFDVNVELSGTWNVAEAYAEWFGAVGDGENDDTLAIQKCIDTFNRWDMKKTYYITNTINCNSSVSINGNNKTILLPLAMTDYVFKIGRETIDYSTNAIRDFTCYCKDNKSNIKQIYLFRLDNSVNKIFQNIKLAPYGIGLVEIGSNVWGCTFDNILAFEYDNKHICVHYIENTQNSGEKITFTNSIISGYDTMFKFELSNYTYSIFVQNCSIDSPKTILNTGNPCYINFNQCHFEGTVLSNNFIGDTSMEMNAMVRIDNSYINFGYNTSEYQYCIGNISGIITNSYITNCLQLKNKNIGMIMYNITTNIFKDIPNNYNLLTDGSLTNQSMVDWEQGQPYGSTMGGNIIYNQNNCIQFTPNGGDAGILFKLPYTGCSNFVIRFKMRRTMSSPSSLNVLMRSYSRNTNIQLLHNQDSDVITTVSDDYVNYEHYFSANMNTDNVIYIYVNGNGSTGHFMIKDIHISAY